MNPQEYIVEVQDRRDGYWTEVCRVPVEYETEEVILRILWFSKVRQTVVKNRNEAIREARRVAWQRAVEEKQPVRIMECYHYDDGAGGYRYEVWRDMKWNG